MFFCRTILDMDKQYFFANWKQARRTIGFDAWLETLERMALRNHDAAWLEPEEKLLCAVLANVFTEEEERALRVGRKPFGRKIRWLGTEACRLVAGTVKINVESLRELEAHGRRTHEWIGEKMHEDKKRRVERMSQDAVGKYLQRHNKWRRGGNVKMQDPTELGMVLDKAARLLRGDKE